MKYELNEERRDGDLEIIRSGNFIIRVERQISQRCQERKKEKKKRNKVGNEGMRTLLLSDCYESRSGCDSPRESKFSKITFVTLATNYNNFDRDK